MHYSTGNFYSSKSLPSTFVFVSLKTRSPHKMCKKFFTKRPYSQDWRWFDTVKSRVQKKKLIWVWGGRQVSIWSKLVIFDNIPPQSVLPIKDSPFAETKKILWNVGECIFEHVGNFGSHKFGKNPGSAPEMFCCKTYFTSFLQFCQSDFWSPLLLVFLFFFFSFLFQV